MGATSGSYEKLYYCLLEHKTRKKQFEGTVSFAKKCLPLIWILRHIFRVEKKDFSVFWGLNGLFVLVFLKKEIYRY